ncbi:MAG TPA: hypothetical protein P5228_08475 [Bacteroidales bacterium]|nr:hypothetical protein [Bacteroidales bacterium]HRZ48076.1 hypothetical protein [Bacteroidales bacterium]
MQRILLLIFVAGFLGLITRAQDGSKFKFTGNAGIYYDYYQNDADNYPLFRPRFPEHLVRFSSGVVFQLGDYFSIPINIDLTNQEGSQFLPNLPEERFIGYVQNPRNNIRISPTWKWFRADLGTHTPSYSYLTTGDMPVFGAGVELKPGKFLFSASYGRSQEAVNADPLSLSAGAYEQHIFAARIGGGSEQKNRFVLNLVHLKDLQNSLDTIPAGVRPRAALTVSPELQLRFARRLYLKTETAVSVATHNLLAAGSPKGLPGAELAGTLFPLNLSSYADFSNISSIEWRTDHVTFGGEVRFLGAGFVPAGYRVAENDLVDYNLKTGLQLFDNRLIFNGTGGLRITNLSETRLYGSRRLIASTNLYLKLSDRWSLNALYTNFGYRNQVLYDTLRVEMIQQMASMIPTWRYAGKRMVHTFSAGPSLQYFDELNAATGETQPTRSESAQLNYQAAFSGLPLSVGFNGLYLDNETPASGLKILHGGVHARYRFSRIGLTPSANLSVASIRLSGFTTDYRTRLILKTEYRIKGGYDIGIAWNLSHYTYGSRKPNATTLENRMSISVRKRFI